MSALSPATSINIPRMPDASFVRAQNAFSRTVYVVAIAIFSGFISTFVQGAAFSSLSSLSFFIGGMALGTLLAITTFFFMTFPSPSTRYRLEMLESLEKAYEGSAVAGKIADIKGLFARGKLEVQSVEKVEALYRTLGSLTEDMAGENRENRVVIQTVWKNFLQDIQGEVIYPSSYVLNVEPLFLVLQNKQPLFKVTEKKAGSPFSSSVVKQMEEIRFLSKRGGYFFSDEYRDVFYERFSTENSLLLEEEGQVVGLCLFSKKCDDHHSYILVDAIAIHPSFFGLHAENAFFSHLGKKKIPIHLKLALNDERAQDYYASLGFSCNPLSSLKHSSAELIFDRNV